jgi:putative addiction module antidote
LAKDGGGADWLGGLAGRPQLRYNARMNTQLKITRIGNSAGVILPKELLARLRLGPGDTIYATEAPDGVRLTAADPDFEAKMAVAETIMREDRDILRVLAK